jgi:hypothetical protein
MALAKTTLSGAVGVNDTFLTVASAAGIQPGMNWRSDGESGRVIQSYVAGSTQVQILRGQDGSATSAHKSGADITFGTAADFASPLPQQSTTYPMGLNLPVYGYSASGAIAPGPGIHVLYGAAALTMTVAVPTQDQTGALLVVINSGNAAHTVTFTTGMGGVGGASDIATYTATQKSGLLMMAMNGTWANLGTGNGVAVA